MFCVCMGVAVAGGGELLGKGILFAFLEENLGEKEGDVGIGETGIGRGEGRWMSVGLAEGRELLGLGCKEEGLLG